MAAFGCVIFVCYVVHCSPIDPITHDKFEVIILLVDQLQIQRARVFEEDLAVVLLELLIPVEVQNTRLIEKNQKNWKNRTFLS